MPDDKIIQEISDNSFDSTFKIKLLQVGNEFNSIAKKIGKMRKELAREAKLCNASSTPCEDPGDELEIDIKAPSN